MAVCGCGPLYHISDGYEKDREMRAHDWYFYAFFEIIGQFCPLYFLTNNDNLIYSCQIVLYEILLCISYCVIGIIYNRTAQKILKITKNS